MPNDVRTPRRSAQSVLLTVALGATVAALSWAAAQVSAVTEGPAELNAPAGVFAWLSLASLRATLEPLGVKAESVGTAGALKLTFPGESRPITLRPAFSRSGQAYSNAISLVGGLMATASQPARLEGWTNPTLSVGRVSFTLGAPGQPVEAYALYATVLGQRLVTDTRLALRGYAPARLSRPEALKKLSRHVVRAPEGATVGSVFGVAAADDKKKGAVAVDVARVSAQGTLEFLLPWKSVEFTRDPKVLGDEVKGVKALAVLVRLTGRLDDAVAGYEVVLPSPTTSEEVK